VSSPSDDRPKPRLRRAHWAALRAAGAARFPGVEGRIPNFVGAEAAAERLRETPEFRRARVLKCNPDMPQRPVRHAALKAGKVVLLAVPRLRTEQCFLMLDPATLPPGSLWTASSVKGATALGVPLRVAEVPPVDLVVSGCVAAGQDGARLGKGGGYADLEYALLRTAGALHVHTPVATTIHDSQLQAAGVIPREAHDVGLHIIATASRLVRPGGPIPQPGGVLWDALPTARVAAMPALARRAPQPRSDSSASSTTASPASSRRPEPQSS